MRTALSRLVAVAAAVSAGAAPGGNGGAISELRLEYTVTRSSPSGAAAASAEFDVPQSYFSERTYEFSMRGDRWKSTVRDHWHAESLGSYCCAYDGKVYARSQPGNIHAVYSNEQLQGKDWQSTTLFSDPYLQLLMFQLPDRAYRLGQPLDSVLTTTLPPASDSAAADALLGTFASESVKGGTTRAYARTQRGAILLTKSEEVLGARIVCCTTFSEHKEMLGVYWPMVIERAWYCNPKGPLARGDVTGELSASVVAIERYQVTTLQERAVDAYLEVQLPAGAFIQDYRYHDEDTSKPVSYFKPVTPERIRESYAARAKLGAGTFRSSSGIDQVGLAALLAVLASLVHQRWSRRKTASAQRSRT
jgi:hypothetical protein